MFGSAAQVSPLVACAALAFQTAMISPFLCCCCSLLTVFFCLELSSLLLSCSLQGCLRFVVFSRLAFHLLRPAAFAAAISLLLLLLLLSIQLLLAICCSLFCLLFLGVSLAFGTLCLLSSLWLFLLFFHHHLLQFVLRLILSCPLSPPHVLLLSLTTSRCLPISLGPWYSSSSSSCCYRVLSLASIV